MSMGNRIKELRKNKGLTQEELGTIIGVKKAAIQKYENGDVENLKRTRIKTLAETFGVTPSFLMYGEEKPLTTTQHIRASTTAPILGSISAGMPLEQQQDIRGWMALPPDLQKGDYFYLSVNGDSMEPRIPHGSLILVRAETNHTDGKVCVVLVDNEHTVKRVFRNNGTVELVPENPKYKRQIYNSGSIQLVGVVEKVMTDIK